MRSEGIRRAGSVTGGGDLAEGNALAAVAVLAVLHLRHAVVRSHAAIVSLGRGEWQCVIGVVLSVAIDMVMGTELADSSVLTAIRIMASKVAIVARFCLFNTRDIA